MMVSISIIGYVSKDIVRKIHEGKRVEKIGGKAYYTARALATLGTKTLVFSKTGKKDKGMNLDLKHRNIKLVDFTSRFTPTYENIYPSKNLDKRIWRAELDNFAFTIPKLKKYEEFLKKSKYVLLVPESPTSIPLSTIKYLYNLNPNLCIDIDFYIRRIKKDGHYSYVGLNKVKDVLKYSSIIPISQEDLGHILKDKTLLQKAKHLATFGPKEVIITRGSKGAIIFDAENGKNYRIKAKRINRIVDVTGSGDTFIAAYLHARLKSDNFEKCGKFAARVTETKIRHHAALHITKEKIPEL